MNRLDVIPLWTDNVHRMLDELRNDEVNTYD